MAGSKYSAFISYSHKDMTWGKWLHWGVETFKIPPDLVGTPTDLGPVPAKIAPAFRDEEELGAEPNLPERIERALREASALVVICSPNAAQSKWVTREIDYFKTLGREDRIFAIIVDGTPNATSPERECLPPPLRSDASRGGIRAGEPAEPLAPDVRKFGKDDALTRLVSGLLGVGYAVLKPREVARARAAARRAWAVAFAGLVLAVLATGASLVAFNQTKAAWSREAEAKQNLASAYVAQADTRVNSGDCYPARILLAEALATYPATGQSDDVLRRHFAKPIALDPEIPVGARSRLIECDNRIRFDFAGKLQMDGEIMSLAISADSMKLAVGTSKGISFVNPLTATVIATYKGNETGNYAIDYSRDGRYLAATGYHEVIILDAETAAPTARLSAPDVFIDSLRFSEDGGMLICTAGFKGFYVWNTQEALKNAQPPKLVSLGEVESADSLATTSKDGQQLAIFGLGGAVQVWDLGVMQKLKEFDLPGPLAIKGVAYDPRHDAIVLGGVGGELETIRFGDGALIKSVSAHADNIASVDYSPMLGMALTSSWDGKSILWNSEDLAKLHEFPHLSLSSGIPSLRDARMSPDGTWAAIGGDDGLLKLWKARPALPQLLGEHTNEVTGIAFSRDSSHLVSVGWVGEPSSAVIWSKDGDHWIRHPLPSRVPLARVDASPSSGLLVFAGDDDFIYVFDLQGKEIARFEEPLKSNEPDEPLASNSADEAAATIPRRIPSVSITTEGDLIAWIGRDATIRVGDVKTGEIRTQAKAQDSQFTSLQFRPSSHDLAAITADGRLLLWSDLAIWKVLADNVQPTATYNFGAPLAFSAEGRRLAFGKNDRSISLIDVASGSKANLKGHKQIFARDWQENIGALALSPDGDIVISGGSQQSGGKEARSIRVWRASTGEELYTILVNADVLDICFSPDGENFAVALNGAILLYPTRAWLWSKPPSEISHQMQNAAGLTLNEILGRGTTASP